MRVPRLARNIGEPSTRLSRLIRLLCQALRLPARSVKTAKVKAGEKEKQRDPNPSEVSRKLVADCGITIAEIARQVGYPHLPFQRAWHAVIPASQQRPYLFVASLRYRNHHAISKCERGRFFTVSFYKRSRIAAHFASASRRAMEMLMCQTPGSS